MCIPRSRKLSDDTGNQRNWLRSCRTTAQTFLFFNYGKKESVPWIGRMDFVPKIVVLSSKLMR